MASWSPARAAWRPGGPGAGDVHGEALGAQARGQGVDQARLVVDQQQPHGPTLPCPPARARTCVPGAARAHRLAPPARAQVLSGRSQHRVRTLGVMRNLHPLGRHRRHRRRRRGRHRRRPRHRLRRPQPAADHRGRALITELGSAQQRAFSGTVVHTTDLGLPQLPQGGQSSSADLTNLLAGSTTLRVWSAGPDTARVAVVGAFAETDLVRNGTDAWVWRSDQKTAVHTTLAAGRQGPLGRPAATASPAPRAPPSRPPTRCSRPWTPPRRSPWARRRRSPGVPPTSWCWPPRPPTAWWVRSAWPSTPRPTTRCASRCSPRAPPTRRCRPPSPPSPTTPRTPRCSPSPRRRARRSPRPPRGRRWPAPWPAARAVPTTAPATAPATDRPPARRAARTPRSGPGGKTTVVGQGWGRGGRRCAARPAAWTSSARAPGEAAGVGQALEGAFRPVSGAYGSGQGLHLLAGQRAWR